MRFYEIFGNIQMPANLEEQALIERIKDSSGELARKNMSEREVELARMMVSRGLLKRHRIEEDVVYKLNFS
jgi:hypothetical protein